MKPYYIELAGNLGAGLTTVAGYLSENLDAFRFSTDYYRNMLYLIKNGASINDFKTDSAKMLYTYLNDKYSEVKKLNDTDAAIYIEKAVKKESLLKLKELTKNKESIIVDRHYKGSKKEKALDDILIHGYNKKVIYIKSLDMSKNIERVALKKLDYDNVNPRIKGFNVDYSSSYSNVLDLYEPNNDALMKVINNRWFDYIIGNEKSLYDLENNTKELCKTIKGNLCG